MIKPPRSAAAERSQKRVVIVDILEQQMSDLKALRKEVAEAERAAATKRKHEPPQNANIGNDARKCKLVDR